MNSPDYPTLSIIIPALNESKNLHACLSAILSAILSTPFDRDTPNKVEIILCDGGSKDDTIEISRRFAASGFPGSGHPVSVITSPAGRATQMNAGARKASGEILLFLHADAILPSNACHDIIQAHQQGYAMGCFERTFDSPSRLLSLTSRWAGWRVRKSFFVYGDQAIFIRRRLFESLDGYRSMRRFEDLDLAVRAKQHGRWTLLPGPLVTDARRFTRHPLKTVIKDALLTLAWLTGIIEE